MHFTTLETYLHQQFVLPIALCLSAKIVQIPAVSLVIITGMLDIIAKFMFCIHNYIIQLSSLCMFTGVHDGGGVVEEERSAKRPRFN